MTATLPLAQVLQHTLVELPWQLAAVQGLRLAQGLTAIQVGLVEA